MVWRRADQTHARCGVPSCCNPWVHLVTRQLTTFSGLGSLGHFDLEVIGVCEVLRRHSKTPRCHLLDRGTSFWIVKTLGILAALAGIGFRSKAVHCDRQSLVGFGGNRAVRHCSGGEALDDFRKGLYLFDGHWRPMAVTEFEESAQRREDLGLIVNL